jgi:hypothetical protein
VEKQKAEKICFENLSNERNWLLRLTHGENFVLEFGARDFFILLF